jgi:hypothetical protein
MDLNAWKRVLCLVGCYSDCFEITNEAPFSLYPFRMFPCEAKVKLALTMSLDAL